MIPFGTQTVTVQRAALVSDHGTQIADWTTPATHDVDGCSVQPAGGSENRLNRDSTTTLWTVFAPVGADVVDSDRLLVFGVSYEIDGPVKRWAVGQLDHVEIDLKDVAG